MQNSFCNVLILNILQEKHQHANPMTSSQFISFFETLFSWHLETLWLLFLSNCHECWFPLFCLVPLTLPVVLSIMFSDISFSNTHISHSLASIIIALLQSALITWQLVQHFRWPANQTKPNYEQQISSCLKYIYIFFSLSGLRSFLLDISNFVQLDFISSLSHYIFTLIHPLLCPALLK